LDRVTELAEADRHSVEEEMRQLIERSIRSRDSLQEAIREAREDPNRPTQTTEELWEQMRRIREQVATESND
jgi:hypothetical protein